MTGERTVPPLLAPSVDDLRLVLAASGVGTWRWDAASGTVWWDQTLEEMCGIAPGSFGGTYEAWVETLHPEDLPSVVSQVEQAVELLASYHVEHRVVLPDGSVRWLECRGQTTVDDGGAATGTVGCAVDITMRKAIEAERSRALARERRHRDRIEFLAGLTDSAISTPDHLAFLRAAANAAVPRLGDWCTVRFVPEPGEPMQHVVAHIDPAKVAWAEALAQRVPFNPEAPHGAALVMRTGEPQLIEEMTDEIVAEALARPDIDEHLAREALDVLGLTSVITVPLLSSRGILGAMQVVSAESGRHYDADDLALAQVAAARIADAADGKWQSEQHRAISATLQRALLPPAVPDIPGIDLAVAYWPAGTASEVGGDFYDVFAIGPRTWSVLIGDVCGTGQDAAALLGIARHTVRAAARHDQDHESVLRWLNEALLHSQRDRFVTAAYGTLEARPHGWALRLAAGGHPLPIVVRADGRTELVGRPGSLLGVFPEVNVHVTEPVLDVGDVVVLYTDGMTDLPPPYGRTSAQLADLVAGLDRSSDAADLAQAIHAAVTDPLPQEQRSDDIALVVLKVTDAPPA